jgi:hypothetical protein
MAFVPYKIVPPGQAPEFIVYEIFTEIGWIVTDVVDRKGIVAGEISE